MNERSGSVASRLGAAVRGLAAGRRNRGGKPVADGAGVSSSSEVPTGQHASTTGAPPVSAASAPVGPSVGKATIQVLGDGPVIIRYRINGGAEQTETNVTLPWEKQYDVYDEVATFVSVDGGDEPITCYIIMDGLLVSYRNEPRPTCSFAYYG